MALLVRLWLLALVVLLAACQSQPNLISFPSQLSPQLPSHRELTSVPFFPQRTRQCGAASLASVLSYWGHPLDLGHIEEQLYTPGKAGTLALDITAYTRRLGLIAYPLQPSIDDLLAEVNAGHPVLVLQNLGLDWFPQWHFAVVVGYDLASRELVMRSGEIKEHRLAIQAFYSTWRRADFWAQVVLPPDRLPASVQPERFLKVAAELEAIRPDTATLAYQLVLESWPDRSDTESLARLGLANIAYAEARYADARRWLVGGRGLASAVHWNNLAFSLAAMGCERQARMAINCANRIEPGSTVFQSSLEEIDQWHYTETRASTEAVCQLPSCPVK